MKASTELTSDQQAIVTIEVEEEQMQRALQRAAQHVSRIRPVPGFRPGKAPYNLIERAVGKEMLVEEALEDLSKSLYRDALKENDLDPVDQGQLEVVQKEPPIFKYTIPLKPQVKLGDYQSIRLTSPVVEVSDAEVQEVIERFQLNQATMVPVTRAVQKGDTVTLDIQGGIEGREPVDEKNLRVRIGDPKQPALPYEDQLIGFAQGETKVIDYTYPDDSEDESLRGQAAHYTITVHDIKETQLPELNDEFAKALGEFETLEQFKGNIRNIVRMQKERDAEAAYVDQVVDEVVEKSEITFPPILLEREVDHSLTHMQADVKQLGLTWEKYLELAGKTAEEMRAEARPAAEKNLKRLLVINELVRTEDTQVTREEVNAEIERLVARTERAGGNRNAARRAYAARDARLNIEFNLQVNKMLGKLVAQAKGESVSGKILTPDMLKEGESSAIPTGLITDPNQVRAEDWPKGL